MNPYATDPPVPPAMSLNRMPDGAMKTYFEQVVEYEGMLVQRWTALYIARLDDPSNMQMVADLRPRESDEYLSLEFALDSLYHMREPVPFNDHGARL